jgi:hypothetical protein
MPAHFAHFSVFLRIFLSFCAFSRYILACLEKVGMLTNSSTPHPISYAKPHVLETGEFTEPEVENKFKFNI